MVANSIKIEDLSRLLWSAFENPFECGFVRFGNLEIASGHSRGNSSFEGFRFSALC